MPLNPFITKLPSDLEQRDNIGELPKSARDSRRQQSAISREKSKFSGGFSRLDVRSDLTSDNVSSHEFSRAGITPSITPQTNKGKAANIKSGIDRSSLSSDFERGEPSSHSRLLSAINKVTPPPTRETEDSCSEFYRDDTSAVFAPSETGKKSLKIAD